MYNVCPEESSSGRGWSGPEEPVGSAHYGVERPAASSAATHKKNIVENVEEKNSLRVECLARLLLLN